eukprot:1740452-Rhodomonas_salina.2
MRLRVLDIAAQPFCISRVKRSRSACDARTRCAGRYLPTPPLYDTVRTERRTTRAGPGTARSRAR